MGSSWSGTILVRRGPGQAFKKTYGAVATRWKKSGKSRERRRWFLDRITLHWFHDDISHLRDKAQSSKRDCCRLDLLRRSQCKPNCRWELSKPEQSNFGVFLFKYGYRSLGKPSYLDLYNQRSELGLRNTQTRKTDLDEVACSDTGSSALCARVWKIPCHTRCTELEHGGGSSCNNEVHLWPRLPEERNGPTMTMTGVV